jgi:hypothetical protein
MADLWGTLDETEPVESPTVTVAIKTPGAIVEQDLINHEKIRSETDQLRTSLDCSAQIVVAAYKVADYIPNLSNAEHRQFWELQVSLSLFSSNKNAIQYFKMFI